MLLGLRYKLVTAEIAIFRFVDERTKFPRLVNVGDLI